MTAVAEDPSSLVYILAALVVILVLNRHTFARLGSTGTRRMAMIWTLIFAVLTLVVWWTRLADR